MAVTVWKGLGYYMVIYLAGLQGLPADLYEGGGNRRLGRLEEALGYYAAADETLYIFGVGH